MLVQIEVTTRCNFECFYCVGRDMAQQDMTMATFARIMAGLPAEVRSVSLQGEGEPVLHRQLWDMAAAVHDSGRTTYTITNGGYRPTDKLLTRLDMAFDRIGVSLDTLDLPDAERIGRQAPSQTLAVIEALVDRLGASRVDVFSVDTGRGGPRQVRDYLRRHPDVRHIVQPLQRKDDYAKRYGLTALEPSGRRICAYLGSDQFRYYDVTGMEMPCCFIKDTRAYPGIEAMRRRFAEGVVPTCCTGCRELRQ